MQLFGVELWTKSKKDFLEQIGSDVKKEKKVWIATVNPEFMVESWSDKRFLNILQTKTSYNVIDGHGILWPLAIKNSNFQIPIFKKVKEFVDVFFGGKYREKLITGVELMEDLCAMAEKEKIPVYFLGGWEPEKVVECFQNKFKKLIIGGFAKDDFVETLHARSLQNHAVIFVALGMKKQEFWIEENWEKLPVGIVMGVGRSFDYYAGSIKRAPKWMRQMGLEWLFSLIMDPKHRLVRQLKNLPVFVWKVMKVKL